VVVEASVLLRFAMVSGEEEEEEAGAYEGPAS
jgi:hypothetical protein